VKIFIDTANLSEIRKAKTLGVVDGVTTNPTLLAKEGEEAETLIRKISKEVKGPVNVEVTGITCEEIVKEAKVLATWGDEIVIKIPINQEGLKAVRILATEGSTQMLPSSSHPARPFWLQRLGPPIFVLFWEGSMISVSMDLN